ncbi:DNA cytosine methyltransferase [Trichococcus shcherbakoviae]|uniref:DNA cytosine methyltransferase n=1 Tax=Trichococcus shcherbakoviae TaxID=2094020 RepID=UPI0029F4C654|nr:DNA cytosine methyltransferase [Trichococcus shcherbakoviae]
MIRVVDLFSGAGGLTLGFKNKILNDTFVKSDDYNILFANEIDKNASDAFSLNFPQIPMLNCSITQITQNYLVENNIEYSDVDLVIGGPPCQSFSTVGRRQYDERAQMYKEYRRMLSFLQPKVFLFENVTGLMTMKNAEGLPVLEDIKYEFSDFSDFGINLSYEIKESVMNAKHFGVPQNRERVFLVGMRRDLESEFNWEFPDAELISEDEFLTLEDAIGDLPELGNGEKKGYYESNPYTFYQKLMRNNSVELTHHVNGLNGERMLKIMKTVTPGKGKNYINELVEAGKLDEKYFLTSGYHNTYGKLWWDRPSSTITNNLSTPSSLRCIHPIQNRALTPREGARIQSFPDTFHFIGNKENINSQIGNAVPPLLAMAIAQKLTSFFDNF